MESFVVYCFNCSELGLNSLSKICHGFGDSFTKYVFQNLSFLDKCLGFTIVSGLLLVNKKQFVEYTANIYSHLTATIALMAVFIT